MTVRSRIVQASLVAPVAALAMLTACSDGPSSAVAPAPATAAILSAPGTLGLTGAYNFNEGSGTIAHDVSGNGADATMIGAAWSTDVPIAGAGNYSFDLTGNLPNWWSPAVHWAEIPEAAAALSPGAITVAAWAKASSTYLAVLVSKQLHGYFRDAFVLYRGGGAWNFSIDGDAAPGAGVGFYSPDPAEWTHVAGTFDGTTLRLYLNGVEVANTYAPGRLMTFTGEPVVIGADYDVMGAAGTPGAVPDNGWPGQIDDVEIHNRALTAAEIAQLASTAPPPPPPSSNPATKDDCKKGGWQAYGFSNQGQCVRFIETGKDSR